MKNGGFYNNRTKFLCGKQKKEFRHFFAYLLIVLFACAGVSCGEGKITYKNGDKTRETILRNRDNSELVLESGNFNMVLFMKYFDSGPTLIKYVNRIYRDKYKELGLRVFLITNSMNRDISDLVKKHDISFPVFPIGENRDTLRKFIDYEENEQALIIINPEMKLESIYYFFKEDDIRQLFEKHMTGTITYGSDKKMDKLQVGDTFPGVSIRHIGGSVKTPITNTSELAPQLWFMFSSKCVACALNNYLMQYKLLEDKLSGKLKISKCLIFSHFFQKRQIAEQIKFYKINTPVYLAIEDIPGFESGYYKNVSVDSIVVALTDRNNTIVYFESFPNFVMNFEGGHFNEMLSSL